MVRPEATGYSPFRICTSVPQMVVVVTFSSASSGPTSGIGFSRSSIFPFSTNTVARIVLAISASSWDGAGKRKAGRAALMQGKRVTGVQGHHAPGGGAGGDAPCDALPQRQRVHQPAADPEVVHP